MINTGLMRDLEMTELDEKLSFLIDEHRGENADADLDEVIGDVNLQYRMRRYQIIGDAMRNQLPRAIDTGFHSAVMAQVRAEVIVKDSGPEALHKNQQTVSRRPWAWLKPFAGLAVAASVAIVTVSLWQPLSQSQGQPEDGLVSADQQKIQQLAGQQVQADVVPASTRIQTQGTRWKLERETPGLQQKLNAYLVNHTEYSNSMQGLIPQARVAGFDAQQ
jgi:sigma-E factor negative regulatory protein RseA